MGKSSAPATPNYFGAAQLQGEISKENLAAQNFANRPTINTPFGSQSWSTQAGTDPGTGEAVTQWQMNTDLAPAAKNALDDQMGIMAGRSDLARGFMDRVGDSYKSPFDYGSLPEMSMAKAPTNLQTSTFDYTPGLQSAFNFGSPIPQYDSSFRDTVANQLMERMQPTHDYQTRQMETKLANQGLRSGSEAYNRALNELNQRQSLERFNALDQSGAEAQRLYGMQMQSAQTGYNQNMGAAQFGNQAINQASALDLARMQAQNQAMGQQYNLSAQQAAAQNQLRQQAIAEQAQRRGMSLNEMNALLSGQQVQMPTMPTFNVSGRAETPNIMGATQYGYDAALGATNAQNAMMGNAFGALGNIGSAYIMGSPGGAFRF